MVADYDQSGFAYADYPDANGYGMSLAAPRWVVSEVERLGTLRLVLHSEAAWDDHQDVVACVGIEAPPRAADPLAAGRHRNVLRILRELESRTPMRRSSTSPFRIRAGRACAPSPASARSPPPPSSPPSTTSGASTTRISSTRPRPRAPRVPLGRDPAPRADHHGRPLAPPLARDQAAVSLLRRHPPQAEALRTWALRIAARRGQQVAVVALARRLAGILSALLRDGSVFEPQHVRPPRPTAATLVNA